MLGKRDPACAESVLRSARSDSSHAAMVDTSTPAETLGFAALQKR